MLSPKEQHDRARHGKMMYDDICEVVTREANNNYGLKLEQLIKDNVELLGDVSHSFYCGGVMHFTGFINRRAKELNGVGYTILNKKLHNDLYPRFQALQLEQKERANYVKKALKYLAAIVIEMPSVRDVKALVPSNFTQHILTASDEMFDRGNPLTPQERQAFKKLHREGEEAFIKLQLLEMIRS